MVTSRPYEDIDFSFFINCVKDSKDWQEEECHESELHNFMKKYEHVNGVWLIWSDENREIGISYTVEHAQSNGRPWVGTLLIHPQYQRNGYGKTIITQLLHTWADKGEKIAYAAIPIMQHGWISFLTSCGFEQYKIEKEYDKTYLLCIKPLEKE
ncbi:GNAT family N-acetyltransferase [Bacillus suaedaesalsae]|uniref:GNAT family N-acetyltransferase n=1 Tax=Bacillus suaedaesalsae TaxID=2810349 RepID=A0ABS2DJD9_9BACI|nr:GNAT family N-acetyltransferase [Bacillus suaedaesalsae]MBM6618609.1 GNAT family N-acetyltransferase [Bacillus suaedaesalsae]